MYKCIQDNNIDRNNKKYKKKPKSLLYCGNCGKSGHVYRNCNDPITSYGVIMILLSTNENIIMDELIDYLRIDNYNNSDSPTSTTTISYDALVENYGINSESSFNIQTFCNYKNNIKFLMIRRKHTLGYIEFVRGRYNVENVDGIIFLFRQMTPIEIKRIGTSTFDELWDDLWDNNKNKVNYQHEYVLSKNKFERLRLEDEGILGLYFYVDNVQPNWDYPEWGFPKGRRNHHEGDLECGIREFKEESGFIDTEFILLDKIEPLEEIFIGTNGITYKHVYFLAMAISDRDPKLDIGNKIQSNEIGDIGWYTYEEAINMIRPYHIERKKLLTEIYMYTLNSIIGIRQKMHKSLK